MKIEDKEFLLTNFEPITPIEYNGHRMAQCPKCGAPIEVGVKPTVICHQCGMLFEVQGGEK